MVVDSVVVFDDDELVLLGDVDVFDIFVLVECI